MNFHDMTDEDLGYHWLEDPAILDSFKRKWGKPKNTCEKCGSENVAITTSKTELFVTCESCGFKNENPTQIVF